MLPNIYPFGIKISMYMLMATLSLVAQILLNVVLRDKMGFSRKKAVLMALCFAGFGFIGTKLIFIFTEFDYFISNLFHFTAFTVYGAIFLLPLAILWFYRYFNCKFWSAMDMAAFSILISTSIWNVGCLCAGCCAGKYVQCFGYSFQFPSQLCDIAISQLILINLLHLEEKQRGKLYPLFLMEFGFLRFFIEFLRGQKTIIWGLNKWQLYAIPCFILGVGLYIWLKQKDKKTLMKNEC